MKVIFALFFSVVFGVGCVGKGRYVRDVKAAGAEARTLYALERSDLEASYRREIQLLLYQREALVERLRLFNQVDDDGNLRPLNKRTVVIETDGSEEWQK